MLWTAVLAATVVVTTIMSDGGVVVKWLMGRKRRTRNKGDDDEQDAEDRPRSSFCGRVCMLSTVVSCPPHMFNEEPLPTSPMHVSLQTSVFVCRSNPNLGMCREEEEGKPLKRRTCKFYAFLCVKFEMESPNPKP